VMVASTSAVLPMPGSPPIKISWWLPDSAARVVHSVASSAFRPTKSAVAVLAG
jgi:hypothetical protein